MKVKTLKYAIAVSSLVMSVAISAGKTDYQQLKITNYRNGGGDAYGSLIGARKSRDAQRLSCNVVSSANSYTQTTLCQGEDGKGKTFRCWSDSPMIAQAARTAATFGYMDLEWDSSGECKVLKSVTGSQYLP